MILQKQTMFFAYTEIDSLQHWRRCYRQTVNQRLTFKQLGNPSAISSPCCWVWSPPGPWFLHQGPPLWAAPWGSLWEGRASPLLRCTHRHSNRTLENSLSNAKVGLLETDKCSLWMSGECTFYLFIQCPSKKNRKTFDPFFNADKTIVVFVKGPEDWWIQM